MSDLNVSLETSSDETSQPTSSNTAKSATKSRLQRNAERVVKFTNDRPTPALIGTLHGRYGIGDADLSDVLAAINQAKYGGSD